MAKLGRIFEALTTPFTMHINLCAFNSFRMAMPYAECLLHKPQLIKKTLKWRSTSVRPSIYLPTYQPTHLLEPSSLKGNSKSTRTFVNLSLRFGES